MGCEVQVMARIVFSTREALPIGGWALGWIF